MGSPGRDSRNRRPWRSTGSVAVAGLLALAMAASLLLVLSESVQLLRVAVVVALWAATVGAIAMTKYRRESALEKAKVDDLKTVYRLQLEREISARREFELGVEEKVRAELRIDADEMAALRAELAALRRNLETLFDGRLPTDGVALQASSERVQALGSGVGGSAPRPSGPAFASPDDEPLTAETTAVPEPSNSGRAAASGAEPADRGPADRGPADRGPADRGPGDRGPGETDDRPRSGGGAPAAPTSAAAPEAAAVADGAAVAASDAAADADGTAEDVAAAVGRRARRRRAEEVGGEGRTVAEILASLSAER